MRVTRHGTARCSQRGIPLESIGILAQLGNTKAAREGAMKLTISMREKSAAISRLKKLIQTIERASETEIVISENGAVLTAYHRR